MLVFDPEKQRKLLDGHTGYKWYLSRFTLEEALESDSVDFGVSSDMRKAVSCILVGYDKPARLFLERARDWLTFVMETKQQAKGWDPLALEANRRLNMALCNWMLHDQNEVDAYQFYVDAWKTLFPLYRFTKTDVSLGIAPFLDAGAYEFALDQFAAVNITAPRTLSALRTEGQMGYVFCMHHLGKQYSAKDVAGALDRFFRRAVNHWLLDGEYLTAAEWMKIAFWNPSQGKMSAKDAILKCYDYLKDVLPVGPGDQP